MPNSIRLTLAAVSLTIASTAQAQLVIAHRGASHDAPENTIAAFKLAWEREADGIEGDFFLTNDGRVACIHDKTTERLAPESPKRVVRQSTADELFRLDVGSWKSDRFAGERIPLLSDVLATVPEDGLFFVEVKSKPEIVEPLLTQLDAGDVSEDRLTIIAFNAEVVRSVRDKRPNLKANWLTGFDQDEAAGQWTPTVEQIITTLQDCGATGLGCQANREVVTPAFADAVRDAGFELHVWTVNEPAVAKHWSKLGVDSITTDRPAVIRRAIEAKAVPASIN